MSEPLRLLILEDNPADAELVEAVLEERTRQLEEANKKIEKLTK